MSKQYFTNKEIVDITFRKNNDLFFSLYNELDSERKNELVNIKYENNTLLQQCIADSNFELAKFLLNNGAKLVSKQDGEEIPNELFVIPSRINDENKEEAFEVMKLLHSRGIDLNQKNKKGNSTFAVICSNYKRNMTKYFAEEIIPYFIQFNPNTEYEFKSGRTIQKVIDETNLMVERGDFD